MRAASTPATSPRRARLRFAATFAALAGVLLAIYSFPYAEHGVREAWFHRFLGFYARLAAGVLRLFDPSVRAVGSDIVGRTSLTVAKNCDAMDVEILFAAAVVAFPAPWRRRAIGLAAGLVLLTAINIVRIAILYFLELGAPRAFEWVHAELAPLVLVATAVTTFVVWSRFAQPPAEPA